MNKLELKKYTDWLKKEFVSPPDTFTCLNCYEKYLGRKKNYEQIVADYFKIPVDYLFIKSKEQTIVFPRQIAIYLYSINGVAEHLIAAIFNQKHPNINHSKKVIENYLEVDKKKSQIINEILNLIK